MLQAVPMGIHAGKFHHGCAESTHVLQLGYSSNCWLRERWSGRIHSHQKIQKSSFKSSTFWTLPEGDPKNKHFFVLRTFFVCQRLAKRLVAETTAKSPRWECLDHPEYQRSQTSGHPPLVGCWKKRDPFYTQKKEHVTTKLNFRT